MPFYSQTTFNVLPSLWYAHLEICRPKWRCFDEKKYVTRRIFRGAADSAENDARDYILRCGGCCWLLPAEYYYSKGFRERLIFQQEHEGPPKAMES